MEVALACFQDYRSASSTEEYVDISKIKPHTTPIRSEGESTHRFPLIGMMSSGCSEMQI